MPQEIESKMQNISLQLKNFISCFWKLYFMFLQANTASVREK